MKKILFIISSIVGMIMLAGCTEDTVLGPCDLPTTSISLPAGTSELDVVEFFGDSNATTIEYDDSNVDYDTTGTYTLKVKKNSTCNYVDVTVSISSQFKVVPYVKTTTNNPKNLSSLLLPGVKDSLEGEGYTFRFADMAGVDGETINFTSPTPVDEPKTVLIELVKDNVVVDKKPVYFTVRRASTSIDLSLNTTSTTIEAGEILDLESFIRNAWDSEGNRVVSDVLIIDTNFDNNRETTSDPYEVNYIYEDKYGYAAEVTLEITVTAKVPPVISADYDFGPSRNIEDGDSISIDLDSSELLVLPNFDNAIDGTGSCTDDTEVVKCEVIGREALEDAYNNNLDGLYELKYRAQDIAYNKTEISVFYRLHKTNQSLQHKLYGGFGFGDMDGFTSINVLENGYSVVTGYTNAYNNNPFVTIPRGDSTGFMTGFVALLDETNNIVWTNQITGDYNALLPRYSAVIDVMVVENDEGIEDDEIFLFGEYFGMLDDELQSHNALNFLKGQPYTDYYVSKFKSNGQLVYHNLFGTDTVDSAVAATLNDDATTMYFIGNNGLESQDFENDNDNDLENGYIVGSINLTETSATLNENWQYIKPSVQQHSMLLNDIAYNNKEDKVIVVGKEHIYPMVIVLDHELSSMDRKFETDFTQGNFTTVEINNDIASPNYGKMYAGGYTDVYVSENYYEYNETKGFYVTQFEFNSSGVNETIVHNVYSSKLITGTVTNLATADSAIRDIVLDDNGDLYLVGESNGYGYSDRSKGVFAFGLLDKDDVNINKDIDMNDDIFLLQMSAADFTNNNDEDHFTNIIRFGSDAYETAFALDVLGDRVVIAANTTFSEEYTFMGTLEGTVNNDYGQDMLLIDYDRDLTN